MPKMNGIELNAKRHHLNPGIKLIFISCYTDNYISHNEILDSDVNDLQKPYSGTELINKIREVLDRTALSLPTH